MFRRNKRDGFSLIEVALGLILISTIVTPMIMTYNIYIKQHSIDVTTSNILIIKSAMERYVVRYGCYPLPGTPGVTSTNATFGQEAVPRNACSQLTALQLAGVIPCVANTTVMCQTPSGTGATTVFIGDLPFAALGLPHEYMLDGYGSKMTYAVTGNLTGALPVLPAAPLTFSDAGGTIIVHDSTGGNTTAGAPTAGNIHYIVVSHGKDRVGAFSLGGVLQGLCNANPGLDNENCNNDATFSDNYGLNGVGVSAVNSRLESTTPGANHYDDWVGWTVSTSSDLWTKQPQVANILNTNTGNVKMGPGALPPNAKADVRGNLKTDAVWTNNLCDKTAGCAAWGVLGGANAAQWEPGRFTPAIIGGTPNPADYGKPGGGIHCNGQALIGIANSDEKCMSNKIPNDPGLNPCPAGQGAVGFKNLAQMLCHVP